MCGLFLYLLTYLIDKLRLKIYFLKGEKSLSAGMEIIFTELMLTERIKSPVQVIDCLRKIQRSLSCNFFLKLPEGSCQEKQDHGNSGRNCGHIISCASLLKRPICITHSHRRKGSVLSQSSTLIHSH